MGSHSMRDIKALLNRGVSTIQRVISEKGTGQEEVSGKDRRIARLRRKLSEAEEQLARLAAAKSAGRNERLSIFFVVGVPKSGTTWLRRMLDSHPEVLCHGEGRFFGRDDKDPNFEHVQANSLGQLMRPGSLHYTLAEYEPLRLWLERTWWSRDVDAEEHIAGITREAVRYLFAQKLSKINRSEPQKRIVGDKTPLHSASTVREIDHLLPEARIIHIIRDGRDQAISHNHHRWNRVRPVEEGGRLSREDQEKRDRYRGDPEKYLASGESMFSEERLRAAARAWISNVGPAHQEGLSALGDRYTEVRYEDLLQRPGEEMARLFGFLGADQDARLVQQAVEAHRFEKLAGRNIGNEDSTSFFRKGVSGEWQTVFTEQDKILYKEIAGDLLIELGYERDNDW